MFNSKKLKKMLYFLLTFLMVLSIKSSVFAKAETVKPTSDFYVNDYSGILTEETKNYILRTASEMGYLPNSSARALKTKRTFNLGV